MNFETTVSSNFSKAIIENYEDIIKDTTKANAFFTTKKVYTPVDFKAILNENTIIIDKKLKRMRAKNFINTVILKGVNKDIFNDVINEWNYNLSYYYLIKKNEIDELLKSISHSEIDTIIDGVLFTILNEVDCRIVVCDFLCLDIL